MISDNHILRIRFSTSSLHSFTGRLPACFGEDDMFRMLEKNDAGNNSKKLRGPLPHAEQALHRFIDALVAVLVSLKAHTDKGS
jgi:hypothetical protein